MPDRIRSVIVDDETRFFETSSKRLSNRGFAIASRTRVCDAMVPVVESIDEDAQMCHAISEMVCSLIQSILVTRDDVVVGILQLSDVFEEVADVIRNHPTVP